MVCHRPEGLEQLEAQTNFTKRELQVLYRGFKNVRPPEAPRPGVTSHMAKLFWCQGSPQSAERFREATTVGPHRVRKQAGRGQGLSKREGHPLHGSAVGWCDLREALPAQVLTLA